MKSLVANKVFNVCSAPQRSHRASGCAQETLIIFLCPRPSKNPQASQSPLIPQFPDLLTESEVTDIIAKDILPG